MLLAAVVAGACAGLAAAMVLLASGTTQSTRASVGLAASVAHLIGCLMLAGGVMLARLATPVPMLLWMLPMYWATLIGLVVLILDSIRSAPGTQPH
jgi:hypothetical protein